MRFGSVPSLLLTALVLTAPEAAWLLPDSAAAQVCNVKVVTDASPDYYDLPSMVQSITGVEDIGREGACAASGGKTEPGHIAKYHYLNATVQARYVRFKVSPERIVGISEVQALDFVKYEPFDLCIALPDDTAKE